MKCSVAGWRRWNDLRLVNENDEEETDGWLGLTRSNALPDVYAFSLGIPDATLGVEFPVNVIFPDPCGIADNGPGHC